MSGLISFLVDVGLFELMIVLMGKELLGERIIVATIVSRLLSAMVLHAEPSGGIWQTGTSDRY